MTSGSLFLLFILLVCLQRFVVRFFGLHHSSYCLGIPNSLFSPCSFRLSPPTYMQEKATRLADRFRAKAVICKRMQFVTEPRATFYPFASSVPSNIFLARLCIPLALCMWKYIRGGTLPLLLLISMFVELHKKFALCGQSSD